jgi:hypothetical protein
MNEKLTRSPPFQHLASPKTATFSQVRVRHPTETHVSSEVPFWNRWVHLAGGELDVFKTLSRADEATKYLLNHPDLPVQVESKSGRYSLHPQLESIVEMVNYFSAGQANIFTFTDGYFPPEHRRRSLTPSFRLHPYLELFAGMGYALSPWKTDLRTSKLGLPPEEQARLEDYVTKYVETSRQLIKLKPCQPIRNPQVRAIQARQGSMSVETWKTAIHRNQKRHLQNHASASQFYEHIWQNAPKTGLVVLPVFLGYTSKGMWPYHRVIPDSDIHRLKTDFRQLAGRTIRRFKECLDYIWFIHYIPEGGMLLRWLLVLPGSYSDVQIEEVATYVRRNWNTITCGDGYTHFLEQQHKVWWREPTKQSPCRVKSLLDRWVLYDQLIRIESQSKTFRSMGRKQHRQKHDDQNDLSDTTP